MIKTRTPVGVAAGVLIRSDGRFLLASRPEGKPYAFYWEFPGGKVEPGESIVDALKRELHEELAIDIQSAYRWVTRVFDYPHALVRLHFCRVFDWRGSVQPTEGQRVGFFSTVEPPEGPLLPATIPVLRWLQLPPLYAISAVALLGRDEFLRRLESTLTRGLKLLQFREPQLEADDARSIFREVLARVRAHGATVLVNSRHQRELWEQANGVHLTAADLTAAAKRPSVEWMAASAHSREELDHAAALDLDFAVAGPVHATTSHPHHQPLGWEAFSDLIADAAVPVYALGGMKLTDVTRSMQCGAHGIASLSAIWNDDQCLTGFGLSAGSASRSEPAIE